MTKNIVKINCPTCGETDGDFCGFITSSNYDEEKHDDIIIKTNHYVCQKCKNDVFVPRTDSNKHDEFLSKP